MFDGLVPRMLICVWGIASGVPGRGETVTAPAAAGTATDSASVTAAARTSLRAFAPVRPAGAEAPALGTTIVLALNIPLLQVVRDPTTLIDSVSTLALRR